MAEPQREGLLSPYRVLDLTNERGLLCGKLLADLGADVLLIEPPQGNSARRLGPFFKDDPHPEKSLFFWAYAANKRSITLNIQSAQGRELLLRLVKGAHFLIESFDPGYMDSLGIGYKALSEVNPSLVMVSITPFGQDGPYAHYKAPDLVGTALSGFLYLTGDPDRPPVRISLPQFYLHGSAAAAAGALIAHLHRVATGEGQYVDVSCQQAMALALANAPAHWYMAGEILKRQGTYRQLSPTTFQKITWACQDGYINFMLGSSGTAWSTRSLVNWMKEEGMGDPFLEETNWEATGFTATTREFLEKVHPPIMRFFQAHTKEELAREAVRRRILLFPVATAKDILGDPQLEARGFFQEVEHPELGAKVAYPGPFVKLNEGLTPAWRRPPLIGEHNEDIYIGELGLRREELTALKEAGVV